MNRKNINKHKLTPQIDAELKALVKSLPAFQRFDEKTGKPMTRKVIKTLRYSELTIEQKSKVNGNPKDTDLIRLTIAEPILANHYINLVNIYQKEGMSGCDLYANQLYKANEEFINAKKEISTNEQ